jgi:hypothetical protein
LRIHPDIRFRAEPLADKDEGTESCSIVKRGLNPRIYKVFPIPIPVDVPN